MKKNPLAGIRRFPRRHRRRLPRRHHHLHTAAHENLRNHPAKITPFCGRTPANVKKIISDSAFNIFHNAGTLIVICAKSIGQHPDWDCCFATQNLMLAAHAMGLATCPIGFAWPLMDDPEVRRELQIPSDCVPVLPIVVGYAANPAAPVNKRDPEILCWK